MQDSPLPPEKFPLCYPEAKWTFKEAAEALRHWLLQNRIEDEKEEWKRAEEMLRERFVFGWNCRVCKGSIPVTHNRRLFLKSHQAFSCIVPEDIRRVYFIIDSLQPGEVLCLKCSKKGNRHSANNPCSKKGKFCKSCLQAGTAAFDHYAWTMVCLTRGTAPSRIDSSYTEAFRHLLYGQLDEEKAKELSFEQFLVEEEAKIARVRRF